MKRFLLIPIVTLGSISSYAGNFVSNTALGSFHDPLSWSFAGDADGIPDNDDNITILAGHQINLATLTNQCLNISVAGRLNGTNASFALTINGDYTNTGQETGTGTLFFRKPNGVISGAGTYGGGMVWQFGESTTIASNVTVAKGVKCRLRWGITVTNNGNFTLNAAGQIVGDSPTSTWLNGATGTLTLRTANFMLVGVRNFLTPGNRLILAFNNTLFTTLGNTFGHLTISTNTTTLANDIVCSGGLTVSGSSTFNMGTNDVSIGGNLSLSNTCTFNQGAGAVFTFNGSTAQTANTGVIALLNLTINNSSGVTWNTGTVNLSDVLTISSGNFAIAGAANFNLLSDGTKTAVIGQCGPTASASGNFTLGRFIGARGAGYSDFSSPVSNSTFADWNNELLMIYNYNPPVEYPSCWGYNESIWDYVPITSSGTALNPGEGYEIYLDSDGSQTTFNATSVNTIGTPNIGPLDISGNITFDNDGWNLIGNPYQAHISWDLLQASASNIATDIQFYDETIEDFEVASTGMGVVIAPAQGFWVNSTGGANLVFTESVKTSDNNSNFRSAAKEMFTLRLKSVGGTRFTSGTKFRFANGSSTEGNVTFKKVPHPAAPALYSVADNKKLRINNLDGNQDQLTVSLKFSVGEDGLYTIGAEHVQALLDEGYTCAQLVDHQLNRTTDITQGFYQFYAAKQDGQDRFSLVLSKSGNCIRSEAVSQNNMIDINRLGENTVVKLGFDKETPVTITVTDLLGQQLVPSQSLTAMEQDLYLPMPQNFSGIYLVNVFYNGQVESKKLFR